MLLPATYSLLLETYDPVVFEPGRRFERKSAGQMILVLFLFVGPPSMRRIERAGCVDAKWVARTQLDEPPSVC